MKVKCNALEKWGLLKLKHRNLQTFVTWVYHLVTVSGILGFKFCGSHLTWRIRREVLIAIASEPCGNGSGRLFLLSPLQGKGLWISLYSFIFFLELLQYSHQLADRPPCLSWWASTTPFSSLQFLRREIPLPILTNLSFLLWSKQVWLWYFDVDFITLLHYFGVELDLWILLHFLSKLRQS